MSEKQLKLKEALDSLRLSLDETFKTSFLRYAEILADAASADYPKFEKLAEQLERMQREELDVLGMKLQEIINIIVDYVDSLKAEFEEERKLRQRQEALTAKIEQTLKGY